MADIQPHFSSQVSCQILFPLLYLIFMAVIQAYAGIAQLVEQRTENPRVTGSSPVPGILLNPFEI